MKVLVAEDDAVSRQRLESFLAKWGYDVCAFADGNEAWCELRRDEAPRLAILDWMMPGVDGIEVCRRIRKRETGPYVYILLVTGRGQKEDILAGLDAGADDYLSKPFDPGELRARLRSGRRIIELQEQLIAAHEQLRVEATHDPLTGLWNRGGILETLHRELARAERGERPMSVTMADVDHFKKINDAYGHLAGDAVLREVGRRMLTAVRPYDAVGRYGGEEFLVISPGCNSAGALNQGERLRAQVNATPIDILEGSLAVTLSLGVAGEVEGRAPEEILRAADAALYQAKQAGRDRVVMAPA